MKLLALLVFTVVLSAACASPSRRIKKNQALFDTFPAAAQEKIRKGEVDVGFTPEMVRIALGKADRVYTRKTEAEASEVWAYTDAAYPRRGLGFSLGIGSFFGSSHGTAGGIAVGTGFPLDAHSDERIRVVFKGGRVSSVENRQKP